MYEPDEHPVRHLLVERDLGQVWADAPVLLGRFEDLIVDPATPGRLDERVVQEQGDPPSRTHHPGQLGDRVVDVVDVFVHEAHDRRVERRASDGERDGGTPHERRTFTPGGGRRQLGATEVQPHDRGARSNQGPRDLALAGPDVEHTPVRAEQVDRQRDDLLLVLGIGARR